MVDRFLGGRECGRELRSRQGEVYAGGGWLMRVGGDLVENSGRGMTERDRTRLANWGWMNRILSWKRQMGNVGVQVSWLSELDVLTQMPEEGLSKRSLTVTSPDWLFPVIITSGFESRHESEGRQKTHWGDIDGHDGWAIGLTDFLPPSSEFSCCTMLNLGQMFAQLGFGLPSVETNEGRGASRRSLAFPFTPDLLRLLSLYGVLMFPLGQVRFILCLPLVVGITRDSLRRV